MRHCLGRCKSALTVVLLAAVMPGLTQCAHVRPRPEAQVTPRDVPAGERDELSKLIGARFNQPVTAEAGFTAAGPFRFVNSEQLLYMDRTDVGSVGFELSRYGTLNTALEPGAVARDALLTRVDSALGRTGLRADGRQFDTFLDEFAGAVQPKGLSIDFDPRTASKHVGRTAAFRRTLAGVPVFNSELIVGLMPDGAIGRFRLHWPAIDTKVLEESVELQRASRAQRWALPESMRRSDITVLESSAGIGHSGFADLGFEARAVVRVLYRKTSADPQYPLASTSYAYFDASGREVVFSRFPKLPGTAAGAKPVPGRP